MSHNPCCNQKATKMSPQRKAAIMCFLDWDVKRISLSVAATSADAFSSNKRPDNLFLHSLVYWSSLGRPRHLNKSTNTKIQEKHSPVKWSYSFLPIRPRHLQRQSTQKRRKFTNFWKYISTYSPPIFRGQQIVSVSSFWAEKFNSSTSILHSTTFTTL